LQSSAENLTLTLLKEEFRGGGMIGADDCELLALVQIVSAKIKLDFWPCRVARQSFQIGCRFGGE
jgi:hypothetical protein